ncbi:unnamed protein product [Sphagnum tenellum]
MGEPTQAELVEPGERRGGQGALVRRFPGPAGWLPRASEAPAFGIFNRRNPQPPPLTAPKATEEEAHRKLRDLDEMLKNLPFQSPPWKKMVAEHCLTETVFQKYNLQRVTHGAEPFSFRLSTLLYVILLKVDCNRFFLKDRSGYAEADICPEVMKEHGSKLRCGTCLVLHETIVLCGKTTNCLLIKEGNILSIYGEDVSEAAVGAEATKQLGSPLRAALREQPLRQRRDEDEPVAASGLTDAEFLLSSGTCGFPGLLGSDREDSG